MPQCEFMDFEAVIPANPVSDSDQGAAIQKIRYRAELDARLGGLTLPARQPHI